MKVEYPYLEVTKPNGASYRIALENIIDRQATNEVRICLGRHSNNQIVLADPQKKISRHHCCWEYKHNRWWIVDSGSANGTFLKRDLNQPQIDVRSQDAIALRSGDYIFILGELDSFKKPLFWRLEFIDPGQTSQISDMQAVYFLEYSLSHQTLSHNLNRRREVIALGEQEHCLIDYMSRKNQQSGYPVICEYDELIAAIWRDDTFGRDRKTINHLVWRIRDKIELDSKKPQFLKTIKGRGYILEIKTVE